ncbi:MAG: RNA polymerase sigma-70 factor (ECF subfamily) [Saprospiraceae bacterium]|jgi:RNA polymerase sigma-70 factor (ECF subfamily)
MKLTSEKENAKDLIPETLMRSYDKRDRFKEGTYFKAWVTTFLLVIFSNGTKNTSCFCFLHAPLP